MRSQEQFDSEFESIMRYGLTSEELGKLAVNESRLETASANFTDSAELDSAIDRYRENDFLEAHRLGFSSELFLVMLGAGLPSQYLAKRSEVALKMMEGTGK